MTNQNQNNAAQAAERQTMLTADELKASNPFQWLGRRYTPEVAERLLREFESVLLSKLRAPVADTSIKQALKLVDELRKSAFAKGVCPDSGACHHNCVSQCARQHELGCVPLGVSGLGDDWKLDIERGASAPVAPEPFRAAFADGALPAPRFHELWESAAPSKNSGHTMLEDLTWQVGKFAALVAAEVRAPVADERAAFEAWALTEFTHPFMLPDPLIPDPDGSGDYVNRDVQMAWAGYQQALAALAIAPVAGEAQPFMYGIMGPDGKAHFEEFCVSGDRDELQAEVVDHLNRDNPEDGPYSVVALFRDSTPQASAEGVRNAALEEAAVIVETAPDYLQDSSFNGAARAIRALKQPQADKDGGQQRAGDAVAAEALAHLRTIANFGGTLDQAKELAARGVWRCAALSAAQAEQGERDAG